MLLVKDDVSVYMDGHMHEFLHIARTRRSDSVHGCTYT